MTKLKISHAGHEEHLCLLLNVSYFKCNFELYKRLVRDPRFVCRECGRTAGNPKNLCAPETLEAGPAK